MKSCDRAEKVLDVMVMEQLLNMLASDVRLWVRERKPKSSNEASQLVDDYIQARRQLPDVIKGEHEQGGSEERRQTPTTGGASMLKLWDGRSSC